MAVCNKYLPKFETMHTLRDKPSIQLKREPKGERTEKKRKHDEIENKSQWFSISRSNSIKFITMNGRAELCWARLLLHLSSNHLFFIFRFFSIHFISGRLLFLKSLKRECDWANLSLFIFVHRFDFSFIEPSRGLVCRAGARSMLANERKKKFNARNLSLELTKQKKLHNSNSTKDRTENRVEKMKLTREEK